MDLKLRDKRVLVTGATRGIGLGIAKAFAAEGARVVFTGRGEDSLTAVRNALGSEAERHLFRQCDFTDVPSVESLAKTLREGWGGVDVVVCNVGTGKSVPDAMPGTEAFAASMHANFYSAELTTRAFLPLLEASSGNLIFIGSIAAMEAFGAPTDYSTAKAALHAMAKQLARKLAPKVRVNVVAPGNIFFENGRWAERLKSEPEKVQAAVNAVPMKRFGTPEEIGNACVFLASPLAGFTTGATLVVDGGQTMHH